MNKKGTPLYSREDIREQYCINDKELQVLDRSQRKSLLGCFSNQGQVSRNPQRDLPSLSPFGRIPCQVSPPSRLPDCDLIQRLALRNDHAFQASISPCTGGHGGKRGNGGSFLGSCIARTTSEDDLAHLEQLDRSRRPISPGHRGTTWTGESICKIGSVYVLLGFRVISFALLPLMG